MSFGLNKESRSLRPGGCQAVMSSNGQASEEQSIQPHTPAGVESHEPE